MANPPTRREPPMDLDFEEADDGCGSIEMIASARPRRADAAAALDGLAAEIRERAFDPTTEAIKRTNAMREAQLAHVAAPALDVDHICNSMIADVVEIHLADGRAVFVTGKMLAAIGWVRSC